MRIAPRPFPFHDLVEHGSAERAGVEFTFQAFNHMLAYLRETGKDFGPGSRMQLADDAFFRLRARTPEEWYLESEGEMLVAERIGEGEASA